MSPLKCKYYNLNSSDEVFQSLTFISVEYYGKVNPVCFTCLKVITFTFYIYNSNFAEGFIQSDFKLGFWLTVENIMNLEK